MAQEVQNFRVLKKLARSLARQAGRAPSDANGRSAGRRQGHLRAAVVVEFARAGATYHPAVGVGSPVCVPVPETPDVAL